MTHSQQQILINHLSYAIEPGKPLLTDLSLSLGNEKTGLVGRNGIGKTSLLRLIAGEIEPDSGGIQRLCSIGYCPQQFDFNLSDTLADYAQIQPYLAAFGLSRLPGETRLAQLSGGELTRLNLAKAFSADPDFIILDEPTNNLDRKAREQLYAVVRRWMKGLLVVSHDRELLKLMDQIIELTTLGARLYGGNYELYRQQKILQQEAAEHDILVARQVLNKTRSSAQATRERSEQKASQGKKLFKTGKIDKMFARAQQGRSERTHGQQARKAENVIGDAEKKLAEAKAKVEAVKKIVVNLPGTYVPNGKVMLILDKIYFSYEASRPLLQGIDLQITGPERVALTGPNGSGKTTLIKLILGSLQPQSGKIYLGTERVRYLSQTTHLLDPDLSLVDNFLRLNPDASLNGAHAALAQFLFRSRDAHKVVRHLSGGERLRAELACILMAKEPPQLLILDEPTNHLDLDSIESIESALANYQGAMLVISHDRSFLENIGVEKIFPLPRAGEEPG